MSSATAKNVFADPTAYLSRRYRLRWRADAIEEIAGHRRFRRILDLGCGDGSLTLPRLPDAESLTLVDMSQGMLDAAGESVPEGHANKVEFVNGSVESFERPDSSFELVVCVGLLAHVDSPTATLSKAAKLVAPGGMLIVELTDASHPLGWMLMKAARIRAQISGSHRWNELRERAVLDECHALGLRLDSRFAYGLPVRLDRVLPDGVVYELGRSLFGRAGRNTNAWLGCERLYAFDKPGGPASSK